MAEENGTSAIERLKTELYRRVQPPEKERSGFYEREFDVPKDWSEANAAAEEPVAPSEHLARFFSMKRLFIASLIFFGIALLFFLFVVLRGSNIVSSRNVSILVDGPTAVKAGEALSLQIVIENKNNTALEFSDLLIVFPQGTRVAKNLEEELTRFRKSLGTIAPHKTVTETVDAALFGQEGDEKEITITLEYRAEDSNAIFVAEKKYKTHISASPFAIAVAAPNEVSPKQEFALEVLVSSEADEAVENILVALDYPFGFSFMSATPEPSFGNSTWSLGDLPKGGKRTVSIRGVLEGQDGDEKVFRIEGGLAEAENPQKLGVVYGTSLKTLRIVRPSLGISSFVGGNDADEVAIPSGARVDAEARLVNNTPTKITDARVAVTFSGDVLEKTSVTVPSGFYRSIDNTIIWDKNSVAALKEIAPGESVRLSFSFAALSPLRSSVRIKNPVVALAITAEGKNVTSEGTQKDVRVETAQLAKVNSDIEFSQRVAYYEGPFGNSGPIPPKAETETTYTVFWTIVNTTNDLRDVVVEARLPAYMRWVDAVSPSNEKITYDPDSRVVKWRAGDVLAWRGVAS
ncbi:MAG: hypothetical protein HYY92_00075, partial [Parcubacteria group bacterium]|nr:hypothetical protein [Parcubacteria group bacterium]